MQNQSQQQNQHARNDKHFLACDMRELRSRYEWSDDDVKEIRKAAAENPAWWDWWRDLAQAHRDGYEQTRENNWIRLSAWKAAV